MIYGAVGLLSLAALIFGVSFDPNVGKWLVLYGFCVVAAVWLYVTDPPGSERWVWAFLIYAGLSLLWSPDWREGLLRFQNIFAVFMVVVFTARTSFNVGFLALAVIAGTAVTTFTHPDLYGGFGNENYRADTILIAAPLLMYLPRFRWIALVGCGAFYATIMTGSIIAVVGVLTAALVAFLVLCRSWFSIVFIGAVVANLAVVTRFWEFLPGTSYWHRVELWHNTLLMWLSSPVFGHGIGSFDYVYPVFAERHLWLIDRTLLSNPVMLATASHSDILQLLAALGVVGFGLGAMVLVHVKWRTWAGVACLCGLGVASVGFPLQVPSSAIMAGAALGASFRDQSLFPVWRGYCWRS